MKPDITLLDPDFLRGMAQVMGDVLKEGKYSRGCWKKRDQSYAKQRLASAFRHALDILDGDLLDKESGLLNAYHLGCNAMIIAFYHNKLGESQNESSTPQRDSDLENSPLFNNFKGSNVPKKNVP